MELSPAEALRSAKSTRVQHVKVVPSVYRALFLHVEAVTIVRRALFLHVEAATISIFAPF